MYYYKMGYWSEKKVKLKQKYPFITEEDQTEADKYGLIFAAMAGYDPREAILFWQRMTATGGGSPPEFLSTHPSDETRMKNLEKFIPEALKFYTPRK